MNMLKSLEIKFLLKQKSPADFKDILPVLLNQYLQDSLTDEQAQMINSQPIMPYSQYILPSFEKDNSEFIWRINALNTAAVENIVYPLYKRAADTIMLSDEIQLDTKSRNYVHSATYNQLVEKNFTADRRYRYIEFSFMTNTVLNRSIRTTFPLPPENILADLLAKWNCFAGKDIIDDGEHRIADDLAKQICDEDYSLNIKPLNLEKGISSFTGSCTWRINANIMSKKLLCILAEYAPYCGIGMDNNLGMGAVHTKIYNHKERQMME